MNTPSIAIVGSGPSGCYAAQALRKHWPDAQIVLIDRLPVPYGLVRYGVAPDHQGTKAVSRQFERLFEREGVRFLGNLEIGRELTLDELRAAFDIVLLATGLDGDRALDIPGERLPQVYGSGRLTRLVNEHPDEAGFSPRFGERCVIVGNGNVAIDILRLLLKPLDHYQGSDLADDLHRDLLSPPPQEIHIVGRSPAAAAKFDTVMLRELAKLPGVAFRIEDLPADGQGDAKLDALRALAEVAPAAAERRVTFRFGWQPQAILGSIRVEAIRFTASQDEGALLLDADSVVSAIGFAERPGALPAREQLAGPRADLERGLLDAGLFCAGWFRRGPRGTIPENRNDARLVAEAIIASVEGGQIACGKPGLAALPDELLAGRVDYAGWQRIDATEQANAAPGRVRRKIRDRARMLAVAHAHPHGE
ncbi:FAD-dependent oxidoreductase [Zestomonas thermotolerans]|uniref:FAD-dependent oxidoreductase n=1 Tax=Zestomonas thermotolerans TaxID=157784 RepID=UPI0004832FE4|nr:FAD-dependent oxidoreductase [Pseudomonas thermotolerans]